MNMGKQKGEIYRELTPAGVGLCIIAGVVSEGITFLVTGIRMRSVPLPVLLFLWGLFGILSAGVLFAADAAGERIQLLMRRIYSMAAERMKDVPVIEETQNEISEEVSLSAQIIYREFWKQEDTAAAAEQRKAS